MRAILTNFYGQLATSTKHQEYAIEANKVIENKSRKNRYDSGNSNYSKTPNKRIYRRNSVY